MYHVAGILTRGDAPERVVGCPQGCAQAVDKVVDKYLRKKRGLTLPSAALNPNSQPDLDPNKLPTSNLPTSNKVVESSTI
jgi:hypothetical protein